MCGQIPKLRPSLVVGGSRCTFIVAQDGKVYALGDAMGGTLGTGASSGFVWSPTIISSLNQFVVKKIATHCCSRHVLAFTADSNVFSWGDGENGQLGHGNTRYFTPCNHSNKKSVAYSFFEEERFSSFSVVKYLYSLMCFSVLF